MTNPALYTLSPQKPKLKIVDGKKAPEPEKPILPLTIWNVEAILREQFQEVTISENEWSRKQGRPSYDITVKAHGERTMEQIQTYLSRFQQYHVGGHRNFGDPDKLNLFMYYKAGPETFYIKFSDVISPHKKE